MKGEAQFWEMLSRLGCASIKEFSLGPREGLLKEGLLQQLYLSTGASHQFIGIRMLLESPRQHGNHQDESPGSWPGFSTSQQSQSHTCLGPVLGPPFSTGEVGRKANEGLIGVISEKIVKL